MIAASVRAEASWYTFRYPRAAIRPAVTSRESPGKKTPIRSPVSEKTIIDIPSSPAHRTRSGRFENRWKKSVIACIKPL